MIVWEMQATAALCLEGVAIAQGCVGQKVSVHLRFSGTQVGGYVRAPGSVEMIAPELPTRENRR